MPPPRPASGDTIYVMYVTSITVCPCWPASTTNQKRPGDIDLWPFDLESGVRITCDVGYVGLYIPLCQFYSSYASLFSSYARCTRQTDVRQKHRLMPPPITGGGIIMQHSWHWFCWTRRLRHLWPGLPKIFKGNPWGMPKQGTYFSRLTENTPCRLWASVRPKPIFVFGTPTYAETIWAINEVWYGKNVG